MNRDRISRPRIAILYTTFPVRSETFVQRELLAIAKQDMDIEVWSLHRGDRSFAGIPVHRFSKWKLWRLVYRLPIEWVCRPRVFIELLHLLLGRGLQPSFLNLGENLLGMGFAIIEAPHFRRFRPDRFHGVWGSLPAMAAWVLSRLCGVPFSFEAHAYDLYEHGGDWFLREKVQAAQLIRSSTAAGVSRLLEVGADPEKVAHVRRGLLPMPVFPERELIQSPVRLVSVGRLVEKKGYFRQLQILAAFREAGIDFTIRIIGEGPLREKLERAIETSRLTDRVELTGWLSVEDTMGEMMRADVLLHTGRIARSGDRDGLPNVLGEAMSVGTVVLATPDPGVSEAVVDGETGFLCPLGDAAAWLGALRRLLDEPETVQRVRNNARNWVEEHFDAARNMGQWYGQLSDATTSLEQDDRLL